MCVYVCVVEVSTVCVVCSVCLYPVIQAITDHYSWGGQLTTHHPADTLYYQLPPGRSPCYTHK